MSKTDYDKAMLPSWHSFEEYNLCVKGHVQLFAHIFMAPKNPSYLTLISAPSFRQFIGVIKVLFSLEFFL